MSNRAPAAISIHLGGGGMMLPGVLPKVRDRAPARKVPGWTRQPSAAVLAACLALPAAGRSNAITGNATACLGQLAESLTDVWQAVEVRLEAGPERMHSKGCVNSTA
jgi:hypothetical protein